MTRIQEAVAQTSDKITNESCTDLRCFSYLEAFYNRVALARTGTGECTLVQERFRVRGFSVACALDWCEGRLIGD
jgi:hypothetical protein